mmetsp:Transcript_32836/g.75570  ORF Transcript_32836/g.75570 Transcript_32836/m.75570 type:complete len:412 (-) Transcript_32836:356-1591(-)
MTFNEVSIGMTSHFEDDTLYEKFDVIRKVPHPKFDKDTFDNDVMLVFFNGQSKFSPVCLASKSTEIEAGKNLHILGFGLTEDGSLSDSLLETDVRSISISKCYDAYKDVNIVTESMMCADSSREGKDACQGDSGGPLILKGKNNQEDIQVGIISWGKECGEYPGVYSLISSNVEWIKETVDEFGGIMSNCAGSTPSSTPIYRSMIPTYGKVNHSTDVRKCSDEINFTDPQIPKRFSSNGCEWVKIRPEDRCLLINSESGRRIRSHCPKTCNYCGKTVTDNANFRNGMCSKLEKYNKWKLCQYNDIRANCPASCSCVHLNAKGNTCRNLDDEKCKNSKCRSFHALRICAEKCGLCKKISTKKCPVNDYLAVKYQQTKLECKFIALKKENYKRVVCRNSGVKAACPNACHISV